MTNKDDATELLTVVRDISLIRLDLLQIGRLVSSPRFISACGFADPFDSEELDRVLVETLDHVHIYIANQERLMANVGYKFECAEFYAQHVEDHADFAEAVSRSMLNLQGPLSIAGVTALVGDTKQWLKSHVNSHDFHFSNYVIARTVDSRDRECSTRKH